MISDEPKVLKGPIYGWWFVPENYKLTYGDGRTAEVGVTHSVSGTVKACSNGLHASQDLVEALHLCPDSSTQLFLVKLDGQLDGHNWLQHKRCYEKVAGERRTYEAHVTVNHAVIAIIKGVLRKGIDEQNARIKRYGKGVYKKLPAAIVKFAKDGVLTKAFDAAIAKPKFDTLREVIDVLRSKDTLTHKELTKVVGKIGEQFAMEKGEIWALTEMIVQKLMRKQRRALAAPKRKSLPRR